MKLRMGKELRTAQSQAKAYWFLLKKESQHMHIICCR